MENWQVGIDLNKSLFHCYQTLFNCKAEYLVLSLKLSLLQFNPKQAELTISLAPGRKEECLLAHSRFLEPRSSRGKSIPAWATERNTVHQQKISGGKMDREEKGMAEDTRIKRK